MKWEAEHCGSYRLIYPIAGRTEKYDRFFQSTASLFTETTAFRVRAECARQLREELIAKEEAANPALRNQAHKSTLNNDNSLRPESPERGPPGPGGPLAKRRPPRRLPAPAPLKRFTKPESLDRFTNVCRVHCCVYFAEIMF